MSQGVNSVTIVGNLGKDPELREGNGQAICKFSVAVGERRKEGDKYVDHTEWFNVVCFGKTAENAAKYLQKGRQVYCDGRLSTRTYEKDGQTRYFTEVVANQVLFLGGGDREAPRDGVLKAGNVSGGGGSGGAGFTDDDQLPF